MPQIGIKMTRAWIITKSGRLAAEVVSSLFGNASNLDLTFCLIPQLVTKHGETVIRGSVSPSDQYSTSMPLPCKLMDHQRQIFGPSNVGIYNIWREGITHRQGQQKKASWCQCAELGFPHWYREINSGS